MSEQTTSEKFTKIEKELFDIYDMIKELTKNNKHMNSNYEQLNSKFDEFTKKIENEADASTKKLTELHDTVTNKINKEVAKNKEENAKNMANIKVMIDSINSNLNEAKKTISTHETEISNHKKEFDKLKQEQTKNKEDLIQSIDKTNNTVNSKLEKMENDIGETLNLVNENVKTKLEEQQKIMETHEKSNQESFSKVFDVIDNHAGALKSYGTIYNQLKSNIDIGVEDLKKDQENLMASMQKIINGQIENIRNELLTFSKEIRTNLNKFSDENVNKFTSIQETEKLSTKLNQLEADLSAKSNAMRKDMSESIKDSMKNFDAAIKQSISSVDEYRVDLERFKDDIESLIERKVNEQTEFTNELFNNLLTKSEQLSQLIRDSKLEKTPEIAIPIPGIKDSKRKEGEEGEK